jgi:Flp pilus assembly pilin Flp
MNTQDSNSGDMSSGNNLFDDSDAGATLVEYALLVGLMAIGLIAAITFMQQGVSQNFSTVTSSLQ